METFEEYKKRREKENEVYKNGQDNIPYLRYSKQRKALRAQSVADEIQTRTQALLNSAGNMQRKFADRYDNQGYTKYKSDYNDWYKNFSKLGGHRFKKEYREIEDLLKDYKDVLDEDWSFDIGTALNQANEAVTNIKDFTRSDWASRTKSAKSAEIYGQNPREQWENQFIDNGGNKWAEYDIDAGKAELEKIKAARQGSDDIPSFGIRDIENLASTDPNMYDMVIRVGDELYPGDPVRYQKAYQDILTNKKFGYGSVEKMDRLIADKSNEIKLAEDAQTYDKLFEQARADGDFVAISDKGAKSKENKRFSKNTDSAEELYKGYEQAFSKSARDERDINAEVSPIERAVYNYYIGKGDLETAEKFYDSGYASFVSRAAHKAAAEKDTYLKKLLFAAESGINQYFEGIKNVTNEIGGIFSDDEKYKQIEPSLTAQTSGIVRSNLKGVKKTLYDLANTVTNQVPSITLSLLTGGGSTGATVAAVSMGISAKGNAYAEFLDRGHTKGQARVYSTLIGASETCLQRLLGGIPGAGGWLTGDVVSKMSSLVSNNAAKIALKLGGNAIGEAVEESLQDILEPVFEGIVTGEYGDISISDALYSGMLGALSSLVMGGADVTIAETTNNIRKSDTYRNEAKAIKEKGSLAKLKEAGQLFDAKSVAGKIANQIDENTSVRKIAKLLKNADAYISETTESEIANKLIEKGFQTRDAHEMAEWLSVAVNTDYKFTPEQNAILDNNEIIEEAVYDVLSDNTEFANRRNAIFEARGIETDTKAEPVGYDKALEMAADKRAMRDIVAEKLMRGDESYAPEGADKAIYEAVKAKKSEEKAKDTSVARRAYREASHAVSGKVDESAPDVAAVVKINNDNTATVRLENGKEVNTKDVEYSSRDKGLVIESVVRLGLDAEAANRVINGYTNANGVTVEEYIAGIEGGIKYGRIGYNITKASEGDVVSYLAPTQKEMAFDIGQQMREADVSRREAQNASRRVKSSEGNKTLSGTIAALNAKQKAQINTIEKVTSKITKNDVVFFESVDDKLSKSDEAYFRKIGVSNAMIEKGFNGFYDPRTGTIYLDLNAGSNGSQTIIWTYSHELTHYIRDWSPSKFNTLADFLMKEYGKKSVDVKSYIEAQADKYHNGDIDAAYEEFVGDSLITMFTDSDVASKLAKLKATDKTLWQKVKDFFADLYKKLTDALANLSPNTAEARLLKQTVGDIEKISDIFAEGVVEASENFEKAMTPITKEGKAISPSVSNYEIKAQLRNNTDSDGNVISNEQREFYQNSKVRDKDGNLLVVYHGTDADFDKFDFSKAGKNGRSEGYGFYFTDDQSITKRFGEKQKKVYLNIEKPAYSDRKTLSIPELEKLISALIRDESNRNDESWRDGFASNYVYTYTGISKKDCAHQIANTIWDSNDNDLEMIYELAGSCGLNYDVHGIKTFYDTLYDSIGVDGSIIPRYYGSSTVYVAFRPEQAKYTNNASPTFNPDLRYQLRNEAVDNRSLLVNVLETAAESENELKALSSYRTQINSLNRKQTALSKMRRAIRDITFRYKTAVTYNNVVYNRNNLAQLKNRAAALSNEITKADKKLLKIEATDPIRNVLENEKKRVAAEYRKKISEGITRRLNTISKHKIMRVVDEIDALYNRGNKKHNVKTEMRDSVKRALDVAKILFDEEGATDDLNLMDDALAVAAPKQVALIKKYRDALVERNALIEERDEKFPLPRTAEERAKKAEIGITKEEQALKDRIDKARAEVTKRKKPLAELFEQERRRKMQEPITNALNDLSDAYQALAASETKYMTGAYKPEVVDKINSLKANFEGATIADMTPKQLESVYDVYKLVLSTVRDANKIFIGNQKVDVEKKSWATIGELDKFKQLEKTSNIRDEVMNYIWNERKPIFAIDKIGSETLKEAYMELEKGAGVAAHDFDDALKFATEIRDKYNYKKMKLNKRHTIDLVNGKSVTLTTEQLMSIYAYSKREQALKHMANGGFVIESVIPSKKLKGLIKEKLISKYAYRFAPEDLNTVVETLKAEDENIIKYVDEMQNYLSADVAEKGNEAARKLYGIDLFKEKIYFPLKSSYDYMVDDGKAVGERALANSGMAKETVPNAQNPIMLNDFDTIWQNHIADMANYHGMLVPIDTFTKLVNFSDYIGESTDSVSVKSALKSVFGNSVNDYLHNLIVDLNGGIMADKVKNPFARLVGRFKTTAVAASWSVIVQQPTAILRAMAMVNPKYFTQLETLNKSQYGFLKEYTNMSHKKKWTMLKKYSDKAIIKEMGSFDVGNGRRSTDYLNQRKTAIQKLDDITMRPMAIADEVGWNTLWDACLRETADKTGLKGEELLKAAGERFDEVVMYTQVYDSTLSRSGYMRSKSDITRMATVFMGEPTTSINMLEWAVTQAMRGDMSKVKAVGTVAAVISSIIAANAAKAIITAARDDDDEKAYLERYAKALSNNVLSDLFIPNMLPWLRDITNIVEGWDVERSDMELIADLIKSIKQLSSETVPTAKKIEGFAGSVGNFFGIPIKNVMKDVRGIYNVVNDIFDSKKPNAQMIGEAIIEGIPFVGKATAKSDSLYKAIMDGDAETIKRAEAKYDSPDKLKAARRKGLRDNDERIEQAAEARNNGDTSEYARIVREIKSEGRFGQDDIVAAVNSALSAIKKDSAAETAPTETEAEQTEENKPDGSIYSRSDLEAEFDQGNTSQAQRIIDDMVQAKIAQGKDEKEAKSSVRSMVTGYYKDIYISASKSEQADIRKILYGTGLYGKASDVVKTCNGWVRTEKTKTNKKVQGGDFIFHHLIL